MVILQTRKSAHSRVDVAALPRVREHFLSDHLTVIVIQREGLLQRILAVGKEKGDE